MPVKLSIITPSFNQGKYISNTINSVIGQNLRSNLEFIIMDAESSDNTDKIINDNILKIKKSGIIFKYIRKKDHGQSDAINKGWKIAQGEIVCWLNSDDYYEKKVLSRVINYFETHPKIKWAYGGWNFVDEEGQIFKTISPRKFDRKKLLTYDNIAQPSCFVKKDALNEVGYLDEKLQLTMDYDLWLRLADKYPAGIISKTIANLRCYTNTKSSNRGVEQLTSAYNLAKKYSSPLTFLRFNQKLYYYSSLFLISLKLDIANRIKKKIRIPFFD